MGRRRGSPFGAAPSHHGRIGPSGFSPGSRLPEIRTLPGALPTSRSRAFELRQHLPAELRGNCGRFSAKLVLEVLPRELLGACRARCPVLVQLGPACRARKLLSPAGSYRSPRTAACRPFCPSQSVRLGFWRRHQVTPCFCGLGFFPRTNCNGYFDPTIPTLVYPPPRHSQPPATVCAPTSVK